MTGYRQYDDEWDEDSDDDWNDESSSGDNDDDATIPCPSCRREIHEDADRCPYCERYLSDEDAPAAQKPWWFVVGFVLCVIVLFSWMISLG